MKLDRQAARAVSSLTTDIDALVAILPQLAWPAPVLSEVLEHNRKLSKQAEESDREQRRLHERVMKYQQAELRLLGKLHASYDIEAKVASGTGDARVPPSAPQHRPPPRLLGGAAELDRLQQQLTASLAREKQLAAEAQRGASPGRVICVGDIHGNLDALVQLWAALGERLGAAELHKTHVVFLGDYCDRGGATRGVIEWLLELKASHGAPIAFLCGNHDFGMAAFLGCLPIDGAPPFDLESTLNPKFELYDPKRDQITYWPHPVEEGMHYLGRRWAQGAVYTARPTMESYGLTMRKGYGQKKTGHDDSFLPPELRDEFAAAVPAAHKQFLSELQWVHEQRVAWGGTTRLVCAHAGLDTKKPLDEQLAALHARDLAAPALYADDDQEVRERIIAFTERKAVWGVPAELDGSGLLVSGHHGISFGEGNRIILDRSGGLPDQVKIVWDGSVSKCTHPLEAIVLPERLVVGHDGSTRELTSQKERIGTKVDEERAKAAAKVDKDAKPKDVA